MCFCSTDRTHRCRFSWERTRQCVVFSCHGNSILYHSCDGGPWPDPMTRPHDWLHVWLLCRPHDWSQDRLQDWPKMQRQRAVLHPCDVFLRKTRTVCFFLRKNSAVWRFQTYASFVKKNKSQTDSSVSWSVSNTFEELNIIIALYNFWLSRICLQKRLPRDWANWRTIFGLWESRPVKRWGRRQSTVSPDVNAKTQQYKYKYKAPCLPMLMWRHRNTSCPASGSFNNPPVAKIFIWRQKTTIDKILKAIQTNFLLDPYLTITFHTQAHFIQEQRAGRWGKTIFKQICWYGERNWTYL